MSEKGPAVRSLKAGVIIVVVCFVLVLLGTFIYQIGPPEFWNQWFRIAWGKLTASQDQRRLCNALNRYYEAHGEYPPYLLGGEQPRDDRELLLYDWLLSDTYGEVARAALARAHGLKGLLFDPLMTEGYLRRYPTWAYYWDREPNPPCDTPDPRGLRRMRNIVSAPNDPIVQYYRALASPVLEKRLALELEDGELPEGQGFGGQRYFVEQGLLQTALGRSRYFCGGVYERAWSRRRRISAGPGRTVEIPEGKSREACAFVAPVVWALSMVGGASIFFQSNSVSGQFGYQRGDFIEAIDGTAKDAWLWFYGHIHRFPEFPEELYGLDLVDNDDGLIQPDGIPDGIVVLYKLKEGKVIEVVKKYD